MDRISKATLGRLPLYLQFLRSHAESEMISATRIAKGLGLGEILVRKDLASACGGGRPRGGFRTADLIRSLEKMLGSGEKTPVVIIGAGRLGQALLGYNGFGEYGLEIIAGFDIEPTKIGTFSSGKPILDDCELKEFCGRNHVRIAALTVPAEAAQRAADLAVSADIRAIWNFAPQSICVPDGVLVRQENLALSLAHLGAASAVTRGEKQNL